MIELTPPGGVPLEPLPEATRPAPAAPVAAAAARRAGAERLDVAGIAVDGLDEAEVVRHVVAEWQDGRGGRVVTPNVDILRAALANPEAARLVADAELVVTDGVPLLWLARCLGHLRLTRVTGADLIFSLSAAAAEQGASIYLLGGPPGAAERAAEALVARHPDLVVAGCSSPPFGFDTEPDRYAAAVGEVVSARPDIVFCGLGFPKQERFAETIRPLLPHSWFVGCGAAILFASGEVRRAPLWMQRSGLEWSYRLVQEPSRLWRRYLLRDLPFLTRLLVPHLISRFLHPRGRRPAPAPPPARHVVHGPRFRAVVPVVTAAPAAPVDGVVATAPGRGIVPVAPVGPVVSDLTPEPRTVPPLERSTGQPVETAEGPPDPPAVLSETE